MKEFVFTKNIENQADEFKAFIGNPNDVKFVEIVCYVGDEVPLLLISNSLTKISEHLSEETEVMLNTVVDETMNSHEIKVQVKITED